MVAALQRIAHSFSEWSGSWVKRGVVADRDAREESRHMVGQYHADYSELGSEELAACDPDADALIARSRVVSSKRL
ncbi:MAG: hypothetical protein M9939_01975 [Mesorhizobium sp.]|uniref:hypothetical protein n=1 Tax=Aquamicrobium sp. TaxID=1872579 RepID=UPI002615C4D1|nr:hypothetical protein [Mesorhizobium sp.]MCO5146417.1 hypothetical protein [Aquamicrobium sp.]MCO5159878.1 hypothetical protein [Mesorhizobium sp.]